MGIILIPLGGIDDDILENLRRGLAARFLSEVGIARARALSLGACEKGQQRLATPIIRGLMEQREYGLSGRVLGIVDRDLYAPGLSFVFGVAMERAALISITRLRQGFYGLPDDRGILLKRALIEAVHELGHTYGLEHCVNPRCVMFYSSSVKDTDRKGDRFCSACAGKLPFRAGKTTTPPAASPG